MIWRARQYGWADQRTCRKRDFEDEAVRLLRDLKRGTPTWGGVLGHAAAAAVLKVLVSDVYRQLVV